jgi:hypothetical protein
MSIRPLFDGFARSEVALPYSAPGYSLLLDCQESYRESEQPSCLDLARCGKTKGARSVSGEAVTDNSLRGYYVPRLRRPKRSKSASGNIIHKRGYVSLNLEEANLLVNLDGRLR